MMYYKFNPDTTVSIEQVFESRIVKALVEFDNGNQQLLHELHLATTDPNYRTGGYCFPLTPYLKRFWVKDDFSIFECYALNKTDIRKNYGRVKKIVKVD